MCVCQLLSGDVCVWGDHVESVCLGVCVCACERECVRVYVVCVGGGACVRACGVCMCVCVHLSFVCAQCAVGIWPQ